MEVRILKGLRVCFAEVRILKDLTISDERRGKAQRWRGDDEVVGKDKRLRFMLNHNMIVTICQ